MKEFHVQSIEDQLKALTMAIKFADGLTLNWLEREHVKLKSGGARETWCLCLEHKEEEYASVNILTVVLFSYDVLKLEVYNSRYDKDDSFIKAFHTYQEFVDYIPELYQVIKERA